nr:VOC family protein [Actibacterium sp. 188UL27-1]
MVAIVVPDYEAGLAFYVAKLGWDLREDIELGAEKRWVVVAPPDSQCAVLLARASGPDQTAAIGNQTGGRVGFFLRVGQFDKAYQAMVAAGVVFEGAPRHESYGSVAVWQDPFGNRWDLLGPPPV